MSIPMQLLPTFQARFGRAPTWVVRAPGRVNLIGEHTDYNEGFCLPMAIDRAIWIALHPRQDQQVRLHSLNFEETISIQLEALDAGQRGWRSYVAGVAWALQQSGYTLCGWEGVMWGDVPIGSGLSSSAALEMALLRAFAAVSDFSWEPLRMARLGQQVENEWLQLRTGLMDQLVSASGRVGQALFMDCRTLSLTPVPLPPGVTVIIMDTKTARDLVTSAYNQRWAECEAAARYFGVTALRDVSVVEFERQAGELDPVLRRRTRHVISENARTQLAAEAMAAGNVAQLGALMDASHESLRTDYEVTGFTLDAMVMVARRQPGCLGARMTGAGFGGCAIALVGDEHVPLFMANVEPEYLAATNIKPELFACRPAEGASVVRPL